MTEHRRDKNAEYQRAYRARNREKVRANGREYQRKRRLADPEKFRVEAREQKRKNPERSKETSRRSKWRKKGMPEPTRPRPEFCECCGRPPSARALANDHCHYSNVFRGWLCSNCNSGIGKLGDDIPGIVRALKYLCRVPRAP
jgi:hypothetical protein